MTSTEEIRDDPGAGPRWLAGRPAGRRWTAIAGEAAFIVTAWLLYSLVRGLSDGQVGRAFTNADSVITAERALGMFVEPDIQGAALGSVLIDLANAVYSAFWPIVIGVLGWLLIWHPHQYRLYRNALVVSGGLSLVVFALYPLAPPRFLPEHGFVDTIAVYSEVYAGFSASALVNDYAAMPSLHVGWVLLMSVAVWSVARWRAARITAGVVPLLMFAATLLTANHYIIDGLAGGLVIGFGLATAKGLRNLSDSGQAPASMARIGV